MPRKEGRRDDPDARTLRAAEYQAQPLDVEVLAELANDYQRYLYCRKKVEYYRDKWFAGDRRTVAAMIRSSHTRHEREGYHDRIISGKVYWAKSAHALDMRDYEERWWRSAQMYLMAWQTQLMQASLSGVIVGKEEQ